MLFRSETMSYCQLVIPKDIIFQTLVKLGEIELVQFIDVNVDHALNLPYTSEIYDLADIERQIQYVHAECNDMNVNVQQIYQESAYTTIKEIHQISTEIDEFLIAVREISKNAKILELLECNLEETKCALQFCNDFFISAEILFTKDSQTRALLNDATIDFPMNSNIDTSNISKLEYISGTVSIKNKYAFERMIWRVCKGNFYITYSQNNCMSYEACKNVTSKVEKQPFLIFFQGELIKSKILKICGGFHCNLIQCPKKTEDRGTMLRDILMDISDMKIIAIKTKAQRANMLEGISVKLYPALVKVKKMKQIYFIMNQLILDPGNRFYIGKILAQAFLGIFL